MFFTSTSSSVTRVSTQRTRPPRDGAGRGRDRDAEARTEIEQGGGEDQVDETEGTETTEVDG
jgi:hypothetical protein